MSLFSTKKPRNRQFRKKVVHTLEDSDVEEKPSGQGGEQTEGGSEQPSNGGPATTVTAPSMVKEKVG